MKTRPFLGVLCLAGLAFALGCTSCSPPASSADTIHLTDAGFDEAIKSGVTLVDFWAPWCPPCRAQGPIIDRLATAASDHGGQYERIYALRKGPNRAVGIQELTNPGVERVE